MAKLIPCKVTEKDVAAGRVRLTWDYAATDANREKYGGEGIAATDDEASFLPFVSKWRYILLGGFKTGEYPPIKLIEAEVKKIIEAAPLCECGNKRKKGLQVCIECAERIQDEQPVLESHPRKFRGPDHRENTYETKFGG